MARARSPLDIGVPGGTAGARDGTRSHAAESGFTLIEIVVALGLFALIAAAGEGLVTAMLDVQRHTAGRLDRLADIERAMTIVARDLTAIADAPLVGTRDGVAFARHRGWDGGAPVRTSYRLADHRLERVVPGRPQRLLEGVTAVRWRYYAAPAGWRDSWPADAAETQAWPAAVAVDLDLAGPPPNGHLRRVVDLPVRPLPPAATPPA